MTSTYDKVPAFPPPSCSCFHSIVLTSLHVLCMFAAAPLFLSFVLTKQVLDGRSFTETETAGMLLALLLAGQHSSSTVSSWLGFFIA